MSKIIVSVVLLATTSCGGYVATPIITPSGSDGFVLECDTISYCYQQASESCSHGYNIINSSWGGYSGTYVAGYSVIEYTSGVYTVVIECKNVNYSNYTEVDKTKQCITDSDCSVNHKCIEKKIKIGYYYVNKKFCEIDG